MDVEKKVPEQDQGKKEERGLDKKKYAFTIDYKGCGRSIVAAPFVNKILTSNEKIERDIHEARLRGGMAFESFSPDAKLRQQMIAHLVQSLVERPDWAKSLGDIEDINLIMKIYEEVMKHEDTFRESGKD